jgi:hypothetical protein
VLIAVEHLEGPIGGIELGDPGTVLEFDPLLA